jgi:hypothetical protein
MYYIQKLPSHLHEPILNNYRQYQDLINVGIGIKPYSLLDVIEATEEQCTFFLYPTPKHCSHT